MNVRRHKPTRLGRWWLSNIAPAEVLRAPATSDAGIEQAWAHISTPEIQISLAEHPSRDIRQDQKDVQARTKRRITWGMIVAARRRVLAIRLGVHRSAA